MNRRPPRGRLPKPLSLKKHLERATRAELDEFRRFWMPHDKEEIAREELADRLRRVMSDENVVYGKVELLSEKVRAVLLALLRATHYLSDLQGLFRGVDGLEMEYYEGEAALTALARRGFVRVRRSRDWLHYGKNVYAIPKEVALVMRGLAGTDNRPLDQIFLHSRFRPSGVEAAGNEDMGEVPESVEAAVATLPGKDLKELVARVLESYGGILTRHEYLESLPGNKQAHWDSSRFLAELGRRGLGTVGHVDLREHGLGVDDDVLALFLEVVERYVQEWRARPLEFDLVLQAHGDLLSDVDTSLVQSEETVVRVGKEGSVYKASRAKLAEQFVFPLQPLLDRTEVADRVLRLVRGLHLAEDRGEGRLFVTDKGREWFGRPLGEKVREAYEFFFREGARTLRAHHLRKVREKLLEILRETHDHDGWFPGRSLAMLARNRYLVDLSREESRPAGGSLTVSHGALTELGKAAHDLVTKDLFALGLVEIAMRGREAAAVRLSDLGRRILLSAEHEADGEAKPLVVNPDFEILVLPEGEVDDLLHALDRLAVRKASGEVVHYHLDRRRVERAAVKGRPAAEILDFLREHARAPLPQNVEYSVRSWSDTVRSATLVRGLLFQASDPSVVEAICNHAALKPCVEKVLGKDTVFFNERVHEEQIVAELRALGVYLL